MYQGDDIYTFRSSERSGRGGNRQPPRLAYDPPAKSAGEERIARLEAAVSRLEELTGQMAQVLTSLERKPAGAPPLGQAHGEERAVQLLEAYGEEAEAAAGVSGSAGENLRVSLFAEGGASAVLGQVRILE